MYKPTIDNWIEELKRELEYEKGKRK